MQTLDIKKEKTASATDLSKDVFSIIDSKIQYLKFMIKEVVKDYVDVDLVKQAAPSIGVSIVSKIDEVIQQNALIFEKIEYYNRCLSRMLFLRNQINIFNSKAAFLLISEKQYLKYSEEEIYTLLQQSEYCAIPSASNC